jgi:hypothetical protein
LLNPIPFSTRAALTYVGAESGLSLEWIESFREPFKRMQVLRRKAAISLRISFWLSAGLKSIDSADDSKTRDIGFGSHLAKLSQRMLALLSTTRTEFQSATICSFHNVLVNNEANLWIIARLARANT